LQHLDVLAHAPYSHNLTPLTFICLDCQSSTSMEGTSTSILLFSVKCMIVTEVFMLLQGCWLSYHTVGKCCTRHGCYIQ